MAHELEIRDGIASMFSVRETPWHKLGHVLTESPSWDDAIQLSGTDYPVVCQPVTLPDGRVSQVARVVVRQDTGEEFAPCGNKYVPLQNVEAWDVIRPLVEQGLASLETGGTLRDGRDAWLMVRWNLDERLSAALGHDVLPFAFASNNHTLERGACVDNTATRIVCANTLKIAHGSGRVFVKHTASGRTNLIERAERLWAGVIREYDAMAEAFTVLRARIMTAAEMDTFLASIVTMPQESGYDMAQTRGRNAFAKANDKALDKRNEIAKLWDSGTGHTGDHSAWEAYQALVESIDHGTLWHNGELEAIAKLGETKADAFDAIMAVIK